MGRDYSSSLATGFWLSDDEIEKPFTKHLAVVSHEETRYDEMTGQPRVVKVVDTKAGDYVLYGEDDLPGDPIQLTNLICKELTEHLGFEVVYWCGGDWYNGTMVFVIGPNIPSDEGEVDPAVFADPKFHDQGKAIGRALHEMGMPVRDFRIHALGLVL